MIRSVSVALMVLMALQITAQTVVIKKIHLGGDKITVTYDLEDGDPNHFYRIQLFASKDNFAFPLNLVSGDVGLDIKPGVNKKIDWEIFKEYGQYTGKLALEVRGKVFVPVARLNNSSLKSSYKRGKILPLQWAPGSNTPVHLELFNGTEKVASELNVPNNGHFSLMVPANARPGKNYRIKITSSRSADEFVYTRFFAVKRKVPLVLKAIPVLAVGGVLMLLIPDNDTDPPPSNTVKDPPTLPSG
ncbi:MAG TPA: Ser-Thr-rich GPI-anchored membrane family protein [Chryseosolibacter sp.]